MRKPPLALTLTNFGLCAPAKAGVHLLPMPVGVIFEVGPTVYAGALTANPDLILDRTVTAAI